MISLKYQEPIIPAFDGISPDLALSIAYKIRVAYPGTILYFKINDIFFSDPCIISAFRSFGNTEVFLDLKIHDTIETSRNLALKHLGTGASIITVHASAGESVLRAVNEIAQSRFKGAKILAVTVPTHLSEMDCLSIYGKSIKEKVKEFSDLAVNKVGLDGVVFSPLETASVRKIIGDEALIVNAGIRLKEDNPGNHERYATPNVALKAGANFLVVGTPIAQAKDPVAAFEKYKKACQ